MNIYEKLQTIKSELHNTEMKKSGKNQHSKFSYFELSDFLPCIVKLCEKHKVYTHITFSNDEAKLTAFNAEKPDEMVSVSSPMRIVKIPGANEIQSLGGVQTYQRRYLYTCMFDIVENDVMDNIADKKTEQSSLHCSQCGGNVNQDMAERTQKAFGEILCAKCGVDRSNARKDAVAKND